MADVQGAWTAENEQQFWTVLNQILSAPCDSYELLDNALRSWLDLVSKARDAYLDDEDEIANCSEQLIHSPLFSVNKEYVRTQIIYSLLQEDEYAPLHVIANFLLSDGRAEEDTFRRMIQEGCFVRLLELIKGCGGKDSRLHRLLLQLMYEMSRIERLRDEDLMQIDDGFVTYLFQLIEALADDANDPYHYSVIRVLLVLNEQYMVAATTAATEPSSISPITNRVIKLLGVHGDSYRTFGENIILLLNRETETSQQLLILKLLYLLFTTSATYEYFYTNDLHVLLDVIIRNLLDLPSEMDILRHTYLRVLAPLLAHTQLSKPPHYKRGQILSLIEILRGTGNAHFMPPEPTTIRLLDRVASTPWLAYEEPESPSLSPIGSLSLSQTGSAVNIIANVSEKPGVKTPSRKSDMAAQVKGKSEHGGSPPRPPPPRTLRAQKSLPEVPRHKHGVPVVHPPMPVPRLHVNGTGQKKMPPKLPPPRRRAKMVTVTGNEVRASSEASSPIGPAPLS
ncbi:hypothetical protein QBC36DRAFT_231374 [Triangularia setosa]|uniref:SPIN90/Ldb17 leucine-rich domain-containing protein n=1 Tax=Triangularia setosa TaxID=2587417 RepID=A0AAN7AB68_9PEZI|nr:hypothetical protein QBC36DRAFT_231374 [Podospora setosa]